MCNGVHEAVIHRVQTGKVGMPGKMREQGRQEREENSLRWVHRDP